MDTEQLRKWMNEHDAINETIKGFHYCFNNYMSEDKDEFTKYFGQFDKRKLEVYFDQVSLKIKSWKHYDPQNEDHEFIEVYLDVEYGGEYIGYYSLLFNFSGESIDDFLVWDYQKWYIYQKLDILYEIKEELLKHCKSTEINDLNKSVIINIIDDKINETRKIATIEESDQ